MSRPCVSSSVLDPMDLFLTSSSRRADFSADSNSDRLLNTKEGLFMDSNSDLSWGIVMVEGSGSL